MSNQSPYIIYTKTDEAPALATFSFLPIVNSMAKAAGIKLVIKDISLAARILANFPDYLDKEQKIDDALAELGELVNKPEANIIKLPNISASVPQLERAIKELQNKGYKVPDFPSEPKDEKEKEIKSRYSKVLGSAVNPVLREGNSDRRVAQAVKDYAKKNPHSMGEWSADSQSHVASMSGEDFYDNEKSIIMDNDNTLKITFLNDSGKVEVLKEVLVSQGEVVDASKMSVNALKDYFEHQIDDALEQDLLLSLHLKATMMKVSDPIIFGHAVTAFMKPVFEKHKSTLESIGFNPRSGLADLDNRLETLSKEKREEIKADIKALYEDRPRLAMVDSSRGITNLHVPSDVIIDASMPAAIRSSGKMWGSDDKLHDTKALIPDRSYAGVYQKTIEFCQKNGAFNPATMGSVSNVGLMAKKAEEYGSHDKTFEMKESGKMRVVDNHDKLIFEHRVQKGDIWRMCQTKDIAIKDWVKLAYDRATATGHPAIFWLDEKRAHDANLIKKVNQYLKSYNIDNLEIKVMSPVEATSYTLERLKKGEDTISVTGNVLRDYLTDLFPILELGTSAKMLSIVPLIAGGGLYETGAGGSAPKHVQQVLEENHLRWDSLGEFLALGVSLEDIGKKNNIKEAIVLAEALSKANTQFLNQNKSPSRKVGELDNRGSHFYLTLFWAQALASQNDSPELKEKFSTVARELEENEKVIIEELNSVQGDPVDLDGYYWPNEEKVNKVMRPSKTFNSIIDHI